MAGGGVAMSARIAVDIIATPTEQRYEPVRATLRYDSADPYAVEVDFHGEGKAKTVVWRFARELLHDGIRTATGDADVQVRPFSRHHVLLKLRSHDGAMDLLLPMADVRRFLRHTYRAVPAGREQQDVDTALALFAAEQGLLDEGGSR
jgi:hypothetical protein